MKMRRASAIHLCAKLHISGNKPFALLGVLGWGAALLSTPASAQSPAPQPAAGDAQPQSARVCWVLALQDAKDKPQQLRAVCNNRVLFLGPVTTFQATENQALKAELIDSYFGNERRVWLLTVQDDGQTLREDLTGQIARAAGRGPMSRIDGIQIDVTQFAQTGEVGVLGPPEERAGARADKIELAEQIALERSRRASAATQN